MDVRYFLSSDVDVLDGHMKQLFSGVFMGGSIVYGTVSVRCAYETVNAAVIYILNNDFSQSYFKERLEQSLSDGNVVNRYGNQYDIEQKKFVHGGTSDLFSVTLTVGQKDQYVLSARGVGLYASLSCTTTDLSKPRCIIS